MFMQYVDAYTWEAYSLCMYISRYPLIYVSMYLLHMYICMNQGKNEFVQVHVCMYVGMYVCTYVCMYVGMYVCMYVCMCASVYVRVCVCVCVDGVCVCVVQA